MKEQIDAGNRFLREFDKYAPVVVAFWRKDSEKGRWTLCVACDWGNSRKYELGYGHIIWVAWEMKDRNFDPFRVRLLLLDDPLVKAALAEYMGNTGRPPKIPFAMRGADFAGSGAEEVYFVQGPTRGYSMSTGRETLNQIIDQEAEFFQEKGYPPRKIKLPVLMAYDLAKCGREELGEVAGRIFTQGIGVLEKDGFHGMNVEIVHERNAKLELE